MPPKARFEASTDTDTCADYLRKHHADGLITYTAISQATGRDIGGKDRHILQSARRQLERENIVFVVETGVGIRRASDQQVATLSTDVPIAKTKRISRTARKRQRAVNVQNLTDDQRAAFYVGRAVLGAIAQATRKAFRNKLQGAVNSSDGPLQLKQTLEMFERLRPNRNASTQ